MAADIAFLHFSKRQFFVFHFFYLKRTIHNIQPVGRILSTEDFYLALKAYNLACLFPKTSFLFVKTCKFFTLKHDKK